MLPASAVSGEHRSGGNGSDSTPIGAGLLYPPLSQDPTLPLLRVGSPSDGGLPGG